MIARYFIDVTKELTKRMQNRETIPFGRNWVDATTDAPRNYANAVGKTWPVSSVLHPNPMCHRRRADGARWCALVMSSLAPSHLRFPARSPPSSFSSVLFPLQQPPLSRALLPPSFPLCCFHGSLAISPTESYLASTTCMWDDEWCYLINLLYAYLKTYVLVAIDNILMFKIYGFGKCICCHFYTSVCFETCGPHKCGSMCCAKCHGLHAKIVATIGLPSFVLHLSCHLHRNYYRNY